jgi:hypothetical protein
MALSPEEKQKYMLLLTLLSQGQSGRQTLATIQPILSLIEAKQNESKLKKEQRRQERNAIGSQVGGLAGSLGGMYMIGQALAPAAAAPVAAGATGATVATPTLVGAQMVGSGGTAGAGAAGGSTLGSIGSVALPVAAGALAVNNAWEGGLKDIVRGRGNRSDYTNSLVNMTPAAFLNMGLRLLGKRSIGQMAETGKSDAQLMRDDFRGVLKEKGIVDKDYNVTLANGTKFNLGLDGKTKYTNSDGKTTRNAWDVDLNDPLAQYATSKIDPYIRNMYGAGDPKKNINPEQYTGMIVNAVTSGAKTKEEIDANIAAALGKKPFEGSTPERPTVAPQQQAPQPPPAPVPTTKGAFMAPPAGSLQPPQPAYRPPAPLPEQSPAPQQPIAPPQNQPSYRPPAPLPAPAPAPQQNRQGLLSLDDQMKQALQGKQGNMDLNGILNMLNTFRQQNNGKA